MLKAIVSFISGAIVGGIAVAFVARKKYRDKDSEIVEMREYYIQKCKEAKGETKKEEENTSEESDGGVDIPTVVEENWNIFERREDKEKMEEIIAENKYSTKEVKPKFEIISQETFDNSFDSGDIDQVTLTYYADDALVDRDGFEVDIQETVGYDALDLLRKSKEGIICVRNNVTNIEFEVFLDLENFGDNDGVID